MTGQGTGRGDSGARAGGRRSRPFVGGGLLAGCALLGAVLGGCGTHPSGPLPITTPSVGTGAPSSAPPAGSGTATPSIPPPTGPVDGLPVPSGIPGRPGAGGPVPMPPPDQSGGTVTVHGTVTRDSAMPSCVVFTDGAGQQFLLTGPGVDSVSRGEVDSAPVVVTGHIGPNHPTHCQLGRTFVADTLTLSG